MSSEKEEKKRRIRPKFQPIQPKVREDNLTIDYEKMELEHLLPELTREIHEKQDQRLTFHGIWMQVLELIHPSFPNNQ